MSHTKGPWIFAPHMNDNTIYADDNSKYHRMIPVCEFFINPQLPTQGPANAKLIAAAPELLEALQKFENDDNRIPENIWEMRNKAIEKATK